ncbi:HU family DNA-binding protein [Bacillus sp. S13(2024)]|uniref:HU family DNA-binding protein n=1 Tax=Bacillus sp. S13(2024) TaxID=3162885 RepID=UPI003D1B5F98
MANKQDLIKEVKVVLTSKDWEISTKETEILVDTVLDTIKGLTAEDGELRLTNFGTFEVRERAARKGRNPQTGEEIEIEASKAPAFKPAKAFKDTVK